MTTHAQERAGVPHRFGWQCSTPQRVEANTGHTPLGLADERRAVALGGAVYEPIVLLLEGALSFEAVATENQPNPPGPVAADEAS
jgi:hypothetical protein